MSTLRLVIPKGRIYDGIARLLGDAGIEIRANSRLYFPEVGDPEIRAKIMKPQNIAQLVQLGSHDAGFTGRDWIVETGSPVVEIMDLGLDPVAIVAAVPDETEDARLRSGPVVVATEYERIAGQWLRASGYEFLLLRTFGASEAFPPQDADMIVDNTATGRTLREHGLRVLARIMDSSTRFVANAAALEDPWKRGKIEELRMLFQSVLDARGRVMLEMNVPADRLEAIVRVLPCMRSPTVAPLYREAGFAVKVAVPREAIVKLVPQLKRMGAADILETSFRKVIA